LETWNADIAVGLTGAFLFSRVFGAEMVKRNNGVIVNVASDLGGIGPDQRLCRKEGVAESERPVKPVTYSVVKTALIGLTRYLSTYWTAHNIRVNAISPVASSLGSPTSSPKSSTNSSLWPAWPTRTNIRAPSSSFAQMPVLI
jgi:NAD(P)-dependent dehydrogenase (short-subunit alcohol dehydrogenase family)